MYDTGKILAGLIIFIGFVTFPFWGSLGGSADMPEPKVNKSISGETCIESKEYMRANHMQILDDWRHSVVRDGNRVYVSNEYKTKFDKSLSSTGKSVLGDEEKKSCMGCHSNKKEFCDSCHNYTAVAPYCWTCHIEPKENSDG